MSKVAENLNVTLIKGADFEIILEFRDENDNPVPLEDRTVWMLVKYYATGSPTQQLLEWTEAGGIFTRLTPLADGRARMTLTKNQILALNFKTANTFLFIEPSGGESTIEGTIIVK